MVPLERQEKLQKSIMHASLERIERYLSIAYNSMGIDEDKMAGMEEN